MVVRAAPFQFTADELRKPVPLTVRLKAAPPEVALEGDRVVIAGTGLGALMVNDDAVEVPPPGAGLNTVTWAVAALAMSAAVIAAVNWVALTYVVVRAEPLQLTTEPLAKPVPLTVRVKAAPPAVALEGERLVRVGTGLDALMVKAEAVEVPPPGVGLKTVTWAVPAVAMSVDVIAAVSCEALTYVVDRADPFQFTTEAFSKPEPLTVRLKAAPPEVALEGDRVVMVGTGFGALMVNADGVEVPPPGAGLKTVT